MARLNITNIESNEVVESIELNSLSFRQAEKAERGALINMDRDRFVTSLELDDGEEWED